MCHYQDLVVLVYTFATDAPHVRDLLVRETDNGRLVGGCYPLNYNGMARGRLNQFNLVNTVRKNAQSLAAVTVVRKEDAVEQAQVFFRRVAKAKVRLRRKAEHIAQMKADGVHLRAWIRNPETGVYADSDFLDVKKGDVFYATLPTGARTTDHDWIARSNGFWTMGYVAGVIADPVKPEVADA